MNKYARILPIVAAVALLGGTIEKKGSFDITEVSLKTPRYPVVALEKKGSFDITEKKGSFDITEAGGKTGDVIITGYAPGFDESVNAGGTSKGGDTPVVTGYAPEFDESVNAGGTSKGGEVPVVPGILAGSGTGKGGDVPVTPGFAGHDASTNAGGKTGDVVIVTG